MATKPQNLAMLTIDYRRIPIPMDKALKVMQLLQGCHTLEWISGGSESKYSMEEELSVSVQTLHADQVVMTNGVAYPVKSARRRPAAALPNDSLKLEG